MQRIGVGVIGLGRAGLIHLNSIQQLRSSFSLIGVSDTTASIQETTAQEFNTQPLSASQLLDHPALDALVVTTPTVCHLEYVNAALEGGKPVFCEKPLGYNWEETESMCKMTEKLNGLLMVGMVRRYDPALLAMHQSIVQINKQPQTIRLVTRDCPTVPIDYIRKSGGFVHDCGIHDVDLMVWLANAL